MSHKYIVDGVLHTKHAIVELSATVIANDYDSARKEAEKKVLPMMNDGDKFEPGKVRRKC